MNIAVIGGGIAGITSAYYLSKKHDVTLFEKSDRLGGNAYTWTSKCKNNVDIAVAVFSKEGYGEFFALLNELNVQTDMCPNTFMSMLSLESQKGLYLTPSFKGGLRQGFDILKPKTLQSLYHLVTGIKKSNELLQQGLLKNKTFDDCMRMIPQLQGDTRLILICTLCLLSSMSAQEVLQAPAEFFVQKLQKFNDILSPKFIFSVVAICGGTNSYITKMSKTLKNIHLNSNIQNVSRNDIGIVINMKDGSKKHFDKVIFACNADQALALLEDPTEKEKQLLSTWKYKEGKIVVHNDYTHFPARDLIQAYTYLYTGDPDTKEFNTSVNGALRFEPQVSNDCDLISSQHPNFSIRKDLIQFETTLRTPMFDFASIAILDKMPELNGIKNSFYCGSHFGYGLHNDAIKSAFAVCNMLGIKTPLPINAEFKPTVKGIFNLAKKLKDQL